MLTGTGKVSQGEMLFFRYIGGVVPSFVDLVTVSLRRIVRKACVIRVMFSCPKVKALSFRDTGCRSCGVLVILYMFANVFIVTKGIVKRSIDR